MPKTMKDDDDENDVDDDNNINVEVNSDDNDVKEERQTPPSDLPVHGFRLAWVKIDIRSTNHGTMVVIGPTVNQSAKEAEICGQVFRSDAVVAFMVERRL